MTKRDQIDISSLGRPIETVRRWGCAITAISMLSANDLSGCASHGKGSLRFANTRHVQKHRLGLAMLALLAMPAGAASAQENGWSFEATVYVYAPETQTSITTPAGKLEGDLSFADALDNLDFAFMGAFGASKGKWGAYLDYLYTDLSFSNATSGPASGDLDSGLKTQILNGYVTYRLYETPDLALDVAGGFRWFSTETILTLTPGTAPGRSSRVEDDWFDPVIGMRARMAFSERWSGTAFVDYGGFVSDSESWQALVTADYALNDNWVLRGGYRYISIDNTLGGNDFSFSQSGPVFGTTYRF